MKQSQGDSLGAIHAFWEAYDRNPANTALRTQLETLAPVVDVTVPANVLSVRSGQTVLFQWSVTGKAGLVTAWNIYLAAPGGAWVQLASDLPGSARQWSWHIPSSATSGAYQLVVHGRAPARGVAVADDWLAAGRSVTVTVQ
jgi:hypothetical protein